MRPKGPHGFEGNGSRAKVRLRTANAVTARMASAKSSRPSRWPATGAVSSTTSSLRSALEAALRELPPTALPPTVGSPASAPLPRRSRRAGRARLPPSTPAPAAGRRVRPPGFGAIHRAPGPYEWMIRRQSRSRAKSDPVRPALRRCDGRPPASPPPRRFAPEPDARTAVLRVPAPGRPTAFARFPPWRREKRRCRRSSAARRLAAGSNYLTARRTQRQRRCDVSDGGIRHGLARRTPDARYESFRPVLRGWHVRKRAPARRLRNKPRLPAGRGY